MNKKNHADIVYTLLADQYSILSEIPSLGKNFSSKNILKTQVLI